MYVNYILVNIYVWVPGYDIKTFTKNTICINTVIIMQSNKFQQKINKFVSTEVDPG